MLAYRPPLSDRYRLIERIATGATASVWRAVDEMFDRVVAVKSLHDHLAEDHDLVGRFADEARVAAVLNHRHLVRVNDTISGPPPAIVLEYVDGPDMRRRLDAGPCTIADGMSLGWMIADGLDAAHRSGLVHRDVKPANIICTRSGEPKLGDFGIATASAGDRTATGLVLGTAKYLAPEQVRGDSIDARTDVYALCVVLYETICGRVPFERTGDLPTAMARLEEPPPMPRSIRPSIPIGVESIVLRGLARDPDARWPSAGALRDAIGTEAERLGVGIGPIDLSPVASTSDVAGVVTGPDADPTPVSASSDPIRVDTGTEPALPSDRPRRIRRAVAAGVVGLVALLGFALVTDFDALDRWADLTGGSDRPDPVVAAVAAFDPEGTGPPGEHDELAANAIDGDPTTDWHTERYEDRMMGPKRGVGLAVELVEVSDVEEVTISSDGAGWAVAVHVADSPRPTVDEWGPPAVVATGLGPEVSLRPGVPGGAVLILVTDLGENGPPHRLSITEVSIG